MFYKVEGGKIIYAVEHFIALPLNKNSLPSHIESLWFN